MSKNVILAFTLLSMITQQVHAQALLAPIETLAINRAEAAIITRVAISRGFAANDPRIAATLTSMGAASTTLNVVSTGAAAALAIAGAPVWLTVAAGLGVLVAGGAIMSGKLTLSLSPDGKTVSALQPSPSSVNDNYPGGVSPGSTFYDQLPTQGIGVYRTPSCAGNDPTCPRFPAAPTSGQKNFDYFPYAGLEIIATTLQQVDAYERTRLQFAASSSTCPGTWCTQYNYSTVYYQWNADMTSATLWESYSMSTLQYDPTSQTYTMQPTSTTQKLAGWTISPSMFPATASDLGTLYQKLDPNLVKQPLDASVLANITNQTWQRAAGQPGYSGLPYSPSQPLTASDVQPWLASNPTAAPTIGDLLSPAADPATNTVTISPTVQPGSTTSPGTDPGTSAGTNPNVNVVNTPNVNVTNKVSVDLGADPGVGSPSLESAPTIGMILSPLINLLPDLKAWAVPSHNAVCPEPSIDLFGKTFKMTTQCDLAESNRTAIYSIFLVVFAIASLFIVLAA
ncbi:hypothetical protein PQQ99_15070 [Paraburkholderia sediminicola]|uniref:hypothetical protein n=1 Tax=Paraburkholderia sediminicola TaxID=458836 RepID=UPI0038BD1282